MLYKGTQPICPIVTVESNPPVVDTLTVTPSTTTQTITPPSGTDGYNTIKVSAVTSAIDSDIVASNIKSGCNILGVNGTVTELVGSTTTITTNGTYTPSNGSNGFTSVSVNVAGTVPSGTYTITANGTYDVTNYASADVSVSGGSFTGINREVVNGVYKAPTTSFTFSLPSNATEIGNYAMYYAFYNCTGLTSVDLSGLTTVNGSSAMYNAFYGCTGLTGMLDLSSLTTVSNSDAMGYTFYGCTGITNVNLSGLTTFIGYLNSSFSNCTNLTNVDLSNLQIIGENSSTTNCNNFNNSFKGCTLLTSISFPKLQKIYCTGTQGSIMYSNGTFAGNDKVQKMYFPKLNTITYGSGASSTNQNACKYIFANCSSLTELHFASANQSAIQATVGYSTAWGRGAGNVTIYFDL